MQRLKELPPACAVEDAMFEHGHEEVVVTDELGHPIVKRSAELVAYPAFLRSCHAARVVAKLCVFSPEVFVEHEPLMKYMFAIL